MYFKREIISNLDNVSQESENVNPPIKMNNLESPSPPH